MEAFSVKNELICAKLFCLMPNDLASKLDGRIFFMVLCFVKDTC